MVANQKVTGKASSMPAALGMGMALSAAITMAGSCIAAYMVGNGTVHDSGIGYCAMIILLASSSFGALLSAQKVKRQWMITCLISGGCYFAFLLGMTALFFGGQYEGMGVTALLILGGSSVTGLLGLRRPKHTGQGRRRRRSR